MRLERYRREISLAVSIVLLGAVLTFLAPGFFAAANLRDMVLANVPVLIAAIGMTLVILTGQIDISTGSQFAIASVVAGAVSKLGVPVPLAGAIACMAGALLGAINGALVSYARIPSIVVTLATMVALRDGLRWVTEGAWVQDLPAGFQWFGQSQAVSETVTIGFAALLAALAAWILRYWGAGRAIYATGSNAGAARLAGIDPARVVFWVFTLAGGLTGCAALFNAVRFNQVPSNAGVGMEMQVIAAVIVGGTSVTGGSGTVAGTLLGATLLGMIGPALTFLGISPYWERAIQGAIILTAVAIDALRRRAGRYASQLAVERA